MSNVLLYIGLTGMMPTNSYADILAVIMKVIGVIFILFAVSAGVSAMFTIGFGLTNIPGLFLGRWQLFRKMGIEGWRSLLPFYNTYYLMKGLYGKGTNFWLLLVPILNIIIYIKFYCDLGKAFKKSGGYKLCLILFPIIFVSVLGLNDDQFREGRYGQRDQFCFGGVPLFGRPNTASGASNTVCPHCGAPLKENAAFCTKCGKRV